MSRDTIGNVRLNEGFRASEVVDNVGHRDQEVCWNPKHTSGTQ